MDLFKHQYCEFVMEEAGRGVLAGAKTDGVHVQWIYMECQGVIVTGRMSEGFLRDQGLCIPVHQSKAFCFPWTHIHESILSTLAARLLQQAKRQQPYMPLVSVDNALTPDQIQLIQFIKDQRVLDAAASAHELQYQ